METRVHGVARPAHDLNGVHETDLKMIPYSIPGHAMFGRSVPGIHDVVVLDRACDMASAESPGAEYRRRLEDGRRVLSQLESQSERLATARLVAFVLLLAAIWFALLTHQISAWWMLPALILFVVLVLVYDQASRASKRSERVVTFYEAGLDRLADRWAGKGNPGTAFKDPEHPYAEDLDLFGVGSLFERIALVRTHPGENILAGWLLRPASLEDVSRRQTAVQELAHRLDLREAFAVLGGDVGTAPAFEGLAAWGAAPRILEGKAVSMACLLLALVTVPAMFAWLFFGQPAWPFLLLAIVEGILGGWYFKRVQRVLKGLDQRVEQLDLLSGMFAGLESARFEAPRLMQLQQALLGEHGAASTQIRRLRGLLSTLEARRNMIVAPISPFLMWGTQVAFAVESWRARSGHSVGGWLNALGEFEALTSLASHAYENPDDTFPTLVAGSVPLYEAEGLGHPLLPLAQMVRNDIRLGNEPNPRALIVSGSNMSGKSTFLRAVGSSVVLAMAGGTVRAHKLTLTHLSLGATLRVQDSLQAGRSRFYAEILRLRQLLELAKTDPPELFLLDEILAGTNSHDRRIGAEAVVLGLLERGAIGLVTTHDLALTEISNRFPGKTENVHFADHFENGKMTFEYEMRPGVVRHSNALELMRSVGLEV